MINEKKLKMAYTKYVNNYAIDSNSESIKEYYDKRIIEVNNIISNNDTDKDHILLISYGGILRYYLSLWKKNILIQNSHQTESFKIMQIATTQSCFAQELYTTRYPEMDVQYTFERVVRALIHFTIWGWEKEEKILFDFISKHMGQHIMDGNEYQCHVWFLLEIYLRYRNQTLLGSQKKLYQSIQTTFETKGIENDLIPEHLGIYDKVLENWDTADAAVMNDLIAQLIEYHTVSVSDLGGDSEFSDYGYGFYPEEILFLLYVRTKMNLPVPEALDDFLMNTLEAQMTWSEPEPYPEWDPMMRRIDDFYRKNYPQYIPNLLGPLFE